MLTNYKKNILNSKDRVESILKKNLSTCKRTNNMNRIQMKLLLN
jgi:hypothetical protein